MEYREILTKRDKMKGFCLFYPACFRSRVFMVLGLVVYFSTYSFGQNTCIYLTDSVDFISYEAMPKSIWIDTTQKATLAQAIQSPFHMVEGNNYGRISPFHTFWFKLKVIHDGENQWFLEFPDAHISDVWCYRLNANSVCIDSSRAGMFIPASKRSWQHKNHLFTLPKLDKRDTLFWLFRIQSRHPSFVQFQWRSLPSYWNYALHEYHFLGVFYGFLAFVVFIHAFLFISTRDVLFLGHIAFVLGCLVYSMGEDALGSHIGLWVVQDFFFRYGYAFWCTGWYIFYESFFRNFNQKPYWFLFTFGGYVLCVMSVLFQYNFHIELSLVLVFWACYQAYAKWRQGHTYALLFLIGFGIVALGQMAFLARVMGWIPNNVFTYYSNYVAYMVYNLVFTLIIAEKVALLRKIKLLAHQNLLSQYRQNLALRDKVNKELEQKVKDRTLEIEAKNQELIQTNAKLQHITGQMVQLSQQVDIENWQLKKEIKKTKKDKIEKETFQYSDFREIYPHKRAVYELLNELKWAKGFKCPKCEHLQASIQEASLTFQCTQCLHEEKPKKNTLLQSIKFDPTQALFIVYHVVESPKQLTVDQLSVEINLRRNTCWAFRKKVKDFHRQYPNLHWKELLVQSQWMK